MSLSKVAVTLLGLGAIVAARPSESSGQTAECQAGTWFYRCANGHVGCFDYDPCSLLSISEGSIPTTTTTTTSTATTQYTTPAHTTSTASSATYVPPIISSTTAGGRLTCPTGTTIVRVFMPTMYPLYPAQPDTEQGPVNYIQLQRNGDDPQLEQAMVYRGIPAEAKKCSAGSSWAQGPVEERRFFQEGNGSVNVTRLAGFPSDGSPITSNSVRPFESTSLGHSFPDMTFWADAKYGRYVHSGGGYPQGECAENMYFKLKLDEKAGDGHLYFEQDFQNGFFLDYTC